MPVIVTASLKYQAIILTESGLKMDVTPIATELSWEENRQELATRVSLSLPNIRVERELMVNKIKPNHKLFIYSDWGNGMTEVFRGSILRRILVDDENGEIDYTAYDNSYYLRSKDQLYVGAQTSCRAAITRILDRWKVPYTYNGPNTLIAKGRLFRGDAIADMILTLLEEARQKGGGEFVVKDVQGRLIIEPVGKNQIVWEFKPKYIGRTNDDMSIEDLVTRVKILSDTGNDSESPVEAVVDGKTQYGILQEIIIHDTDMSLSDAKTAAQILLNDRGSPAQTLSFESPDVPPLRKGDKIQFTVGERKIETFVESVQHHALQRRMSIEVKPK